jgi:hypothetical protein
VGDKRAEKRLTKCVILSGARRAKRAAFSRRITECVILSGAAVALCQSQMNLLLERCCMGIVYQIEDLDNSSKDLIE